MHIYSCICLYMLSAYRTGVYRYYIWDDAYELAFPGSICYVWVLCTGTATSRWFLPDTRNILPFSPIEMYLYSNEFKKLVPDKFF